MHGIIFAELRKYVEANADAAAWRAILTGAGVPGKMHIAMKSYDDEELVALVQSASSLTGTPVPVLLKDFGTFIVPGLMKTYKAFMRPEWRTMDTLEFTESHIHTKVRTMTKGAMPPLLETKRLGPTAVMITYRSARKLCPVAEGIIQGIADYHDERITMTHAKCMNRGNAACELEVRLA
jgi:hypothetical protein